MRWKSLRAGLARIGVIAAWTGMADAAVITYTLEGEVIGADNQAGPWALVGEGDPMQIVLAIEDSVAPVSSAGGSALYGLGSVVSLSATIAASGQTYANFITGTIEVSDDANSPAFPRDRFAASFSTTSHGTAAFELSRTTGPNGGPVPTSLQGTDWPTIAELDVSTFNVLNMEVGGLFTDNGRLTTITGSVDRISVTPEPTSLSIALVAMVLFRRAR